MTKQEANAFFEENYRYYNELGSFRMAIYGPLAAVKKVRKEIDQGIPGKVQADENKETGMLLVDDPMQYPVEIVNWLDLAAKYPELEIAVTGAVRYSNCGEVSAFAWYSPAGSPELEGTSTQQPISGNTPGAFVGAANKDSHMPLWCQDGKFICTLPLWLEEDHDGGYIAVWQDVHGAQGGCDLMDRERVQNYDEEFDGPIPANIAAAVDAVSCLDQLEDGPEGEEAVLALWKTLFPEAGIRIQWEEGKCRYFDDAGTEYFLCRNLFSDAEGGGAFLDRYTVMALENSDDVLFWGFPPAASWIPQELLKYDELSENG